MKCFQVADLQGANFGVRFARQTDNTHLSQQAALVHPLLKHDAGQTLVVAADETVA